MGRRQNKTKTGRKIIMRTNVKLSNLKKILGIGNILLLFTLSLYGYDNEKVHPYVLTSRSFELFNKSEYYETYYKEFKNFFNPPPPNLDQLPTHPALQ